MTDNKKWDQYTPRSTGSICGHRPINLLVIYLAGQSNVLLTTEQSTLSTFITYGIIITTMLPRICNAMKAKSIPGNGSS